MTVPPILPGSDCESCDTILLPLKLRAARIGLNSFALGTFIAAVALPPVSASSADREPASDSLVARWEFDEGAGKVVKDSSGNGNDGMIVSANTSEPEWGKGEFAGSICLSNGTHVLVPPSESLNELKKQITIVANIYPRSLWTTPSLADRAVHLAEKLLGITNDEKYPGYIAVVQRQWRETVHPDLFYLGYGPENDVLHYKWHLGLIGAQPSLYRLPEGQDKPAIGEWVHLAGTYDGETGKTVLYVNGSPIGTLTRVGEIRLDPESFNRPLIIGAELNESNIDHVDGSFDGCIDEVRLYDRALSDEEIKTLADEAGHLSVTAHVREPPAVAPGVR
jgi:hypothetical protein